jgi:hypothetical protein
MKIAEAILVPHGCKSRTHDPEPLIRIFNERRIILETWAVPAGRPGTFPLYGIENFHVSIRSDGSPVMTEHQYRQDVSQNYVYNHSDSERDKWFDPGIRQFAKSSGESDT